MSEEHQTQSLGEILMGAIPPLTPEEQLERRHDELVGNLSLIDDRLVDIHNAMQESNRLAGLNEAWLEGIRGAVKNISLLLAAIAGALFVIGWKL